MTHGNNCHLEDEASLRLGPDDQKVQFWVFEQ